MRKKLNIVLPLFVLFIMTMPMKAYATMDLESDSALGGIAITLNNYYAKNLEPEKGLADSVKMAAGGTIVVDTGENSAAQELVKQAEITKTEIETENAVTYGTVVGTNNLRLREGPSYDSRTLTLLAEGEHYIVVGQEGEFLEVQIDDDLVGYVFKDYIDTTIKYDGEESEEEMKARAEEIVRLKEEADAAMKALEEAKKNEASGKKETKASETAKQTEKAAETTAKETAEASVTAAGSTAEALEWEDEEEGSEDEDDETVEEFDFDEWQDSFDDEDDEDEENDDEGEAETTAVSTSSAKIIYSSVGDATRNAIVAYAKQFLGNPYVYGGTSLTEGTDCSGFTMQVYKNFGMSIGRSSRDQAANGKAINADSAGLGDLFFYDSGGTINHVALYIGGGQVIHASSGKTGIVISNAYYRTPCKVCTFF